MANNMEKLGILNEEQRKKMFSDDTTVLAKKVTTFVENFYPSYSNASITEDSLEKSWDFLRNFTFYRILDCTINKTDDVFKYFADKMQKFFITAYDTCGENVPMKSTIDFIIDALTPESI